MLQDVTLLADFNLMDYSLLFVIEFNPKYVEKNIDKFKTNEDGSLLKPPQLKEKNKDNTQAFYLHSEIDHIVDNFEFKMSGLSRKEFQKVINS